MNTSNPLTSSLPSHLPLTRSLPVEPCSRTPSPPPGATCGRGPPPPQSTSGLWSHAGWPLRGGGVTRQPGRCSHQVGGVGGREVMGGRACLLPCDARQLWSISCCRVQYHHCMDMLKGQGFLHQLCTMCPTIHLPSHESEGGGPNLPPFPTLVAPIYHNPTCRPARPVLPAAPRHVPECAEAADRPLSPGSSGRAEAGHMLGAGEDGRGGGAGEREGGSG
jgi:hypothetical protein